MYSVVCAETMPHRAWIVSEGLSTKLAKKQSFLWFRIWLRCYHRGLLFWLGYWRWFKSGLASHSVLKNQQICDAKFHVEMSSLTVCIYCQHTWGPTSIIDRSTRSGDKYSLGRHVSRGSSDCLIRYTCSTTDYNVSSATMVTRTERLNELLSMAMGVWANRSPQQFSYRGKNACKLWAKVAQQRKHGQFQLSMSLVSVLTSFVHVSEKRSYTSSSHRGMVKRLVRPLLEYRVPNIGGEHECLFRGL